MGRSRSAGASSRRAPPGGGGPAERLVTVSAEAALLTVKETMLLSGNEAVALAALHGSTSLGTGYPGTPSTEILERFSDLGGRAQWSPNEKVALEVGLGVSYGGARAIVTMKHVGVNVAADPLFTAAYTGVTGALVIISADDPGMASSQNEQDNRRYAVAAGVPMLEPSDSQEAYELYHRAVEISERWKIPVILRMTTRVCHSKTIVRPDPLKTGAKPPPPPRFERDIQGRVMIPAHARGAHRRLRKKLAEIEAWNETSPLNRVVAGNGKLGIVTSGIAYMHAIEARPEASVLKLGMTFPLPRKLIESFAGKVETCRVVEEGDPYLYEALRTQGIDVAPTPESFRFGELNVNRVRKLLAGEAEEDPKPGKGKPPELCKGCPHRGVFGVLKELDCIVAGDIGCYTLAVLPPFTAMDTCVCMGASIGVGLGLRHALPPEEARRVVSVIGDSTFVHSGITGLVEMVYNRPQTGHLLMILDNGTTAMTGQQEHPGTGRTLDHQPTGQVIMEDLARSLGIPRVHVVDPTRDPEELKALVKECLDSGELSVIVTRRPCLLATGKIREYEKAAAQGTSCRAAVISQEGSEGSQEGSTHGA